MTRNVQIRLNNGEQLIVEISNHDALTILDELETNKWISFTNISDGNYWFISIDSIANIRVSNNE